MRSFENEATRGLGTSITTLTERSELIEDNACARKELTTGHRKLTTEVLTTSKISLTLSFPYNGKWIK